MKKQLIIAAMAAIAVTGCKKEQTSTNVEPGHHHTETTGSMKVMLGHNVDGNDLMRDSIEYTNAAGNMYTVTKLHYYLSGFRLYMGTDVAFSSDEVFYVDAADNNTLSFTIDEIPPGHYDSVSYYIGLDEAHNKSRSLPLTLENNAMDWPEPMGGGYHFLKLEGFYKDAGSPSGYAMHIGTNNFLVKTGSVAHFNVSAGHASSLMMKMNVNEWFTNPNNYDLTTDAAYSMGNMPMMTKLSQNGMNVFKVSAEDAHHE